MAQVLNPCLGIVALLSLSMRHPYWYFVTSTSDTRSFSMIPVTTSEMTSIGANNALTFHISITGKQAIMNHESLRKRTKLPV